MYVIVMVNNTIQTTLDSSFEILLSEGDRKVPLSHQFIFHVLFIIVLG